MDNSEGTAWVFDSLVGFLHGPVWNVPLQTFIEEKSLPFEPADNGQVLERPEYTHIHEEYKNLVDLMLGSFMEDIGITAEQFEAACHASTLALPGLPPHFHQRLFEQVWAANDYRIFVKMMTRKNVELQLQALELIERRFGAVPNIFSAESESDELDTPRGDEAGDWSDKDDIMTEIKKLQLEDNGIQLQDDAEVAPEEVVAEKKSLITKLHSVEKQQEVAKTTEGDPIQSEDTATDLKKQPPKKVEVSEEELHARQQYLKQQRDKLLALKKQVRQQRLDQAGTHEEVSASEKAAGGAASGAGAGGSKASMLRPRSARAAAALLSGAPPPPPVADALQLRRALATRLKAEVVDGSQ